MDEKPYNSTNKKTIKIPKLKIKLPKFDSVLLYKFLFGVMILSGTTFLTGGGLLIAGLIPDSLLQSEFVADTNFLWVDNSFEFSETFDIENKTFDRISFDTTSLYHEVSDTYWEVSGYYDDDNYWVDTSGYETDYWFVDVSYSFFEIDCTFNTGLQFTSNDESGLFTYGQKRSIVSFTITIKIDYDIYLGVYDYEYTTIRILLQVGNEALFIDPYIYPRAHLKPTGGLMMIISAICLIPLGIYIWSER